MGTRSDIIARRKDGTWARVYCHWDGYLSHNGKILHKHYNTQAKAEKLVSGGDMSSLGRYCNKPPGHSFDTAVKGYTVYYGRDRGEKSVGPETGPTLAAAWPEEGTWTEFTYVWDGERWWVGDPDEGSKTLVLLSDALEGKKTIHPSVKVPFLGVIGKH